MKIIEYFEVRQVNANASYNGPTWFTRAGFTSKLQADEFAKMISTDSEPARVIPETLILFETVDEEFEYTQKKLRRDALAKLTPEEKRALNLVE